MLFGYSDLFIIILSPMLDKLPRPSNFWIIPSGFVKNMNEGRNFILGKLCA